MPEIKLRHIVSFSSEDKVHCAENILKSETYRKWKCSGPGEKNASIVIQFEKATQIHSIDIGNESSAFVEVLVGRSSDSVSDFQVLLVASSFMSPLESRNQTNLNRVRMFGPDKLAQNLKEEKWDRVQVVCTQPFNKNISYGLSFIKFHSPQEVSTDTPLERESTQATMRLGAFKLKTDDDDDAVPSVGSFFERKRSSESSSGPSSQESLSNATTVLASSSSPKPSPQINTAKRKYDVTDKDDSCPPTKKEAPTNHVNKQKVGHINILTGNKVGSSPSNQKKEVPRIANAFSSNSPAQRQTGGKGQNNATTAKKVDSPSTSFAKQSPSTKAVLKEKKKPFHQIMGNVVFTLSGFVNPLRGDIRDKAIEMGAKYKGDWDKACTHLVCAFLNTPKYSVVNKQGGQIVTKEWIFDCYKKKTLLPWKQYMLGKNSRDSSEESSEEDEKPATSAKKSPKQNGTSRSEGQWTITKRKIEFKDDDSPLERKKKPSSTSASQKESGDDETDDEDAIEDYIAKTDVDSSEGDTEDEIRKVEEKNSRKKVAPEPHRGKKGVCFQDGDSDDDVMIIPSKPDTKDLSLPPLPNLFKKRHFLLYGEFSTQKRHDLQRYISAYDGVVDDYMAERVKYVITDSKWDKNFDDALEENEDLIFVKPDWIYKCHETVKMVPYQPYIVIPNT